MIYLGQNTQTMNDLSFAILMLVNNKCTHEQLYNVRLSDVNLLENFSEEDKRRSINNFKGLGFIEEDNMYCWLTTIGEQALLNEINSRRLQIEQNARMNIHVSGDNSGNIIQGNSDLDFRPAMKPNTPEIVQPINDEKISVFSWLVNWIIKHIWIIILGIIGSLLAAYLQSKLHLF